VIDTVWVIPCFNEAARLDLAAFGAFLEASESTSLLFVDDGSTDRTYELLDRFASRHPMRTRALRLSSNRGKAEAVRAGLRAASADGARFVGFADADLATPPRELDRLRIELVTKDADAVIGSRVRLHGSSIDRSPARHYLGRIFATAASAVLRAPIYDTQCGAKLFRAGPTLDRVTAEAFTSRWIFDVELIGRLLIDGGPSFALIEVPLATWKDVAGSRVKPTDFMHAAFELVRMERDLAMRRASHRAGSSHQDVDPSSASRSPRRPS